MASVFPDYYDTFTIKIDNVDRIFAAHPNDLQYSVINIEHELGLSAKGSQSSLTDRLAVSLDTYGNSINYFYNKSSQTLLPAQVVVLDKTNTLSVTTSASKNNIDAVGVVTQSSAVDSLTPVKTNGNISAYLIAEDTDINIGDWLTTSSYPGFATKASGETKTYFARSNVSLTSGSSGIYSICVGITNSNVLNHTHNPSILNDGGPLGDDVVNSRILDDSDSYTIANLNTTGSITISGDIIVLGKQIISQTDTISGNTVMAGNLEVYGNSYLGDTPVDETLIKGFLYITQDNPSTTDSDAIIYLGKNSNIWQYLRYSNSNDKFYMNNDLEIVGGLTAEDILAYNNISSNTLTVTGDINSKSITFTETPSAEISIPTAGYFTVFSENKKLYSVDSDGNYTEFGADGSTTGGGSITGILGETIAPGQPSYLSIIDNKWYKAQAIDGKLTLLSFCKTGGNIDDTGTFVRYDNLTGLSGFTPNSEIYLSQYAAGETTTTIPTSGIVAFLGISKSSSEVDAAIALVAYDTSTSGVSGSVGGENLATTLAYGNSAGSYQINMNSNRITNTGSPISNLDSTNKIYVDSLVAATSGSGSGGTLEQTLILGNSAGSSQIDMNSNKIVNCLTPTASGDVATKAYVDSITSSGNYIEKTILTAKGSIISATSDSSPSELTSGSDGYVLTADSSQSNGLKWAAASSSGGGGLTWNEITTTSATASGDNGYIANNASRVTLTLPLTCELGKVIAICGKGTGGWKIAQNAAQTIHFINVSTTTGTGGYIESTSQYDALEMVCITANTDFVVRSSVGTVEMT